jgi:aryl-alcohol dehydrogenase-like predicted oxidoreductase
MNYRRLGISGLMVSATGLGCNNFGWRIDVEGARRVVHKAMDLGVTLFDTADIYGSRGGSENCLGQILGARRKDIVLATKFGMPMADDGLKQGGSRAYIMKAVEDSLRRLRTDWIDLYQMHQLDAGTPIEETLRALDDLVRAGKVRYVGCSNFPAWRMAAAQETAKRGGLTAFVSLQDEYSMLMRGHETDVISCGAAYGMGLLPYFPLAGGLLTGKYRRNAMPQGTRITDTERYQKKYLTDENWNRVEQLEAHAAKHGKELVDLAFGWLLSRPVVASVIAGATSPEQIERNVKACGWALAAGDVAEVDRITAIA